MKTKLLSKVYFFVIMVFTAQAFADFELGVKYYDAKNYEAAYKEFLSSAQYGDNDAQQNLGAMYVRGEYVEKDNIQAYAWLALAAQNTEIKNRGNHLKIFNKLNDDERKKAQEKYNVLLAEYGEEAISKKLLPVYKGSAVGLKKQRVLKRVMPNYPESMAAKGESGYVDFIFGIDKYGMTRDFVVTSTTSTVFEQAAIESLRKFQYEPEKINGIPVEVNSVTLRFKFNLADAKFDQEKLAAFIKEKREKAVTGNASDKFGYAYFLEVIPSFDPDFKLTDNPNEWYLSSAQAGSASASYFLGRNILYGNMCTQDNQQSMGWLLKAAKSGLSSAQYMLAIESFTGARFEKSEERGFYWLERAAQSSSAAKIRLAWLLSTYPDDKRRNAPLALKLLADIDKKYDDLQNYYQAYAAAYAESGDFDNAIKWQWKAHRDAKKLGIPMDRVEQQLESYNNKKPWREEM